MTNQPHILFVLPSLRISGGVQEALLLAERLAQCGIQVQILSLWRTENELSHRGLPVRYLSKFTARKVWAGFQFPFLLLKFVNFMHSAEVVRHTPLMLTHFSTFPFAWLAPKSRWYCFNQDTEWMFVPSGLGRQLLRWFILTASRRANVITTNSFIESQFEREGIHSVAQVSIWADQFWASTENNDTRSIDVVILLRKGGMKRLDLYLDLLTRLEAAQTISCAVVTPDPDIYATVKSRAIQLILRPSNQELRALYRRSKIFVSLSDTEGFGLTPLEAMGQGCVPVCRNSGGVQCYMAGPMQRNLIPRSEPLETVLTRISELLANPKELAANSITAAEIFRDGLKESNARREAAIRSLAKVLKHEPA